MDISRPKLIGLSLAVVSGVVVVWQPPSFAQFTTMPVHVTEANGTAVPLASTGSGTIDSTTQRVVIASNDTLLSTLSTIASRLAPATVGYVADLDETEDELDGTAGELCGLLVDSSNTTPVYVQVFDATAAAVTVGTTPPTWTLQIPEAAASGAATENLLPSATCVSYGTALTVAATTTRTGNTGPSSNVALTAFTR